MLPNVGPYIYDVSISGFTRSSIYVYIYDISSLRVNYVHDYKVARLFLVDELGEKFLSMRVNMVIY